MARGDISISTQGGKSAVPTFKWRVAASATVIKAGEPVKQVAAASPYVINMATSEPTTSTIVAGVAATDSTNTSALDGFVDVYFTKGVEFQINPKTPANIGTDTLNASREKRRVRLDLTSGVYSIIENDTDASTNGIIIKSITANGKVVFEFRDSIIYNN